MMKIQHSDLQEITSIKTSCYCISYTQLKRILSSFDYASFNALNEKYFGSILQEKLAWFAVDGKELRGTIDKISGQKRGLNLVQIVNHDSKKNAVMGFYDGSKESEKTLVLSHFNHRKSLKSQAYSLDALHTYPQILETISSRDGIYLSQVKLNQKHLLEDCKHTHNHLFTKYIFKEYEKAHGRIEHRKAFLYPLNIECLDKKWIKTNIKTLIVVERFRENIKTGNQSKEKAYFISNQTLTEHNAEKLAKATRKHWAIESEHYIRDKNFGEDLIKTFNSNTARTIAVCISWALNLIRNTGNNQNIKALREKIAVDKQLILGLLNKKNFL